MIKLLAVDMDGTCLDSKGNMAEETLEALKKAAAEGIVVVPTTGRSKQCLPEKLKADVFYRYVISSNGAAVEDLKENKKVFESYVDSTQAAEIMKSLRQVTILKGAHIGGSYYTQGTILYHGVRHVLGDDASTTVKVKNLADTLKGTKEPIEQLHLFFLGEKHRQTIKNIADAYEDLEVADSKNYVGIYNKTGSKGKALLALAAQLGIKAEEIACIGDERNDISMFEIAGLPLAMGNAIEEIRSRGKIILPTNDELGVAVAINTYIL